ncbi:TonB-dependent receptor domain-containing protein [Malaciobacter canalis]|uniref:TonB-dependent receptor domain-containing protein n=1 Tax=Malaciobacter canalis TaxID=1912871 RepID=UPI00384E339E
MNRKILLSSIASLAIFSLNANAQDTKKINSVDVWETEIVSSSLNLGKDSIETKQADHLSDLLRGLPGVDVGGSHSMNNKIIIRGIKDEDINITIDGAKQPNVDMFHHQSTLKVNPDILKKVNIEVGANSVVHGELGGSIEFETKDGKDFLENGEKVGAIVSTKYNSNDSVGASLATYGKITDNSDFFIYYDQIENENWKTGDGTKEKGREGTIKNLLLKYGIDLDDTQRVSFSYDRLEDEGDYHPRPNFSTAVNEAINVARGAPADLIHPTEYIRNTYTLKHTVDKGENLLINSSLYFNEMDLTRHESNSNKRGDVFNAVVENKGFSTKAQSNINYKDILNTFTYGFSYDVQTSEVTTDGDAYGDDEESKTFALFIEDTIDFNNGLILTPGIRATKYKLDGVVADVSEKKITYSLAAEYAVTDSLSLLASHTTLFKGAPMQEVFASYRTRATTQNSNIKSETGYNNEVGFKYIKDNVLGADNIGILTKYYVTKINDDIGFDNTYKMVNLGDTKTKGIEASFAYNLNDFNALFTYSRMDSEVLYTGEALEQETGDTFTLGLNYQATPEVGLSWQSIFVKDENDVKDIEKEGYHVHDLAVKYTPKSIKGLKVIAGIDNIFDKAYASHSSFQGDLRAFGDATDYEPGRNFKVTLSYKF